jgi:delta-aminolevulinic acid dehydratase/porphobilinogen synthase
VLGTSGKRMIDIACREADGINLINIKHEKLPEYLNMIKDKLRKYDRDVIDFEISYCSFIFLKEGNEVKIRFNPIGNQYTGSTENLKELINELEENGIKKIILWGVDKTRKSEIKDPLLTFANEVIN